MSDLGRFILLYENFIEKDELWQEKRELSKAEAWIYMLVQANHTEKTVIVGQTAHKCKRGQFITSLDKLRKAFNWKSKNKVRRFLSLLQEGCTKIVSEPIQNATRITICSYSKYRPDRNANGTQTERERDPTNNIISNNIYIKGFSDFWKKYGEKGNFESASAQWSRLSKSDKEEIFERLEMYITNTPVKFRRYAENYLDPDKKYWRDKINGEKKFYSREQKRFGQWIHDLMHWIKYKSKEQRILHENYVMLPKPEKNFFHPSGVKVNGKLYHNLKSIDGYNFDYNYDREITEQISKFLENI